MGSGKGFSGFPEDFFFREALKKANKKMKNQKIKVENTVDPRSAEDHYPTEEEIHGDPGWEPPYEMDEEDLVEMERTGALLECLSAQSHFSFFTAYSHSCPEGGYDYYETRVGGQNRTDLDSERGKLLTILSIFELCSRNGAADEEQFRKALDWAKQHHFANDDAKKIEMFLALLKTVTTTMFAQYFEM